MMKSILVIAAMMSICALVPACSSIERAMPSATLSDADLLGVLNTINRSEIDAGQLARDKASSETVRAYASRMVDEHKKQLRDTSQLAHRIRIEPDRPALATTLINTHQDAMETLRDNHGPNFDKVYLEYQVTMHQQILNLVSDTADSVTDPRFQQFLHNAVPDLQSHLAAAQSLSSLRE